MSRFLVDTNVISELPRRRPNPAVVRWLESQPVVVLSAISVEELAFGVARAKGRAREDLQEWLDLLLGSGLRVVDVTAAIARTAGELRALREAKHRPVAQADMLVAACAVHERLVLATRNVRDFEGCGIVVVNPFLA